MAGAPAASKNMLASSSQKKFKNMHDTLCILHFTRKIKICNMPVVNFINVKRTNFLYERRFLRTCN